MISYAQGYMLLREAGKENDWNLNMGGIALMWRGGCIIRSRFLGKIKEALRQESETDEPAAGRFLRRRPEQLSAVLAARRSPRRWAGHSDSGLFYGAGFL